MSKKKKSSWQTVEEYQNQKLKDSTGAALTAAEAARLKIATSKEDPYMSRNEFKPGFYDQKDRPPITAETLYGKGTKKQIEQPIVSPDDSMSNYAEGGFARGQKAIQVKKVPFRGVF
jgi:hypothetical protein